MKKIQILIMLAVASILSITVASAQISVGAGYLYQSLGEKTAGDYVASHINFDGFYVGADFGIKCGKIFSVVPGIDSSGLNVPPVAETNVPGIAETNVPAVAE